LIAPLVLFLLLVFLVPIVALLYKSVGNPEVVGGMPRTVAAIASWDGRGLPAEPVYKAAAKTSPKPARTRPGRSVQALEHGIGRLSQPADQNRPGAAVRQRAGLL
jgi:hypothetical protein